MRYLKKLLKYKWFYLLAIVLLILFTYPLPYYVTSPGEARELDPIIDVENAYSESGEFMLTTVLVGKANLVSLVIAKFNEYYHVYPEERIKQEGENDKEYNVRQLELMHSAKNTSTVVAFEEAGKEFEVKNKGVLVTNLIADMPAAEKLKTGDIITSIDRTSIQTVEQLNKKLQTYKLNDEVPITVNRDGGEKRFTVKLAKFPAKYLTEETEDSYGLGISYPVTLQEIKTTPSVVINSSDIGGPSAGLMFSLEIFNQITKEDYTKGYRIAGTGTINFKGIVGPIGGIKQKVVAADNAGAEIFFAPVASNNYKDAIEAADDIGTKMKVVPVNTFEDAIHYLEKLPKKRG